MKDDDANTTQVKDEDAILAGDLMLPLDQYPAVSPEASLAKAAAALSHSHIDVRGSISMPRILLVMSDDGAFIGFVRRRDILKGLAPSFLVAESSDHPEKMFDVEIDPNLTELLSGRAAEKLRAKAETPVGEIADPIPTTLRIDDPLIRIIQEMVRHDQAMLPVVKDDRVVGVVRTVEVLLAVSDMLNPEASDDSND